MNHVLETTEASLTTQDRDNDEYNDGNCVTIIHKGDWWYRACGGLTLNDNYEDVPHPTGTRIAMRFIDTSSYPHIRAYQIY